MTVERAVVVGGGISGLVAAYRMSQAGVDVTLVEPGPLGGKVQTSMFAGRPVDEGADAFLLRVPWGVALCRDLELDGELISPAARTAQVLIGHTRHPLPSRHVMGVPTDLDSLQATGILSDHGLGRVEDDLTLEPLPTDPLVAGRDVAIGPYLRGRLGDEVVDHLIDPLVGGINGGDTDKLSLAAVVPQLDAAARSGDRSIVRSCDTVRRRGRTALGLLDDEDEGPPIFAAPFGGMGRIVDALLALMPGVDIRSGRRVLAIEPLGRRVRLSLDDGSALEADAAVVATPAHAMGPLLSAVAPTAGDHLTAIEHASVAFTTLAFDRTSVGDVDGVSGCLVPRDQGLSLTAVSFATSKWAQLRDPARDDVILRASVGRAGDDAHLSWSDDDLVARVVADLDRVVGVYGDPTEVRVTRWTRSFPQYAPGHLERIDAVEAELAPTPIRVAGMALRGVGIPACINSAEEAVRSLGITWPTPRRLA